MTNPVLLQIYELADACLRDELSVEGFALLEQLIQENPAARKIYIDFMHDSLSLRSWADSTEPQGLSDSPAHEEGGSPGAQSPPGQAIQPPNHAFPQSWIHWGGKFFSSGGLTLCIVALLGTLVFMMAAVAGWLPGLGRRGEEIAIERPAEEGLPDVRSACQNAPAAQPIPVARLTRAKVCRWDGPRARLKPGERLCTGQSLGLLAGVAEISFDVGARIILQAPATLKVESGTSVRLSMGKATTEITTAAARGFTIRTPQATFVDQGTEFGVEVTPGGSSRIHVFKGRVDFATNAEGDKPSSATQQLMENGGARLEGDSPYVTLMEDTGESFIRSIRESGRDRHVVAYWRFEDQPLGVFLPDAKRPNGNVRTTVDSSFNGNDLFIFNNISYLPQFSGDVPAGIVPKTGAANRGCLDTSGPLPVAGAGRDVHTRSRFSHASPLDIEKITPAQWTIEASVKPLHLSGGCETFISRDLKVLYRDGKAIRVPPTLAFQVTAGERFAIRFRDADGRDHEAVAADLTVKEDHWYHTAAASDGQVLRLYVDALDGRGYQLRAATDLPQTGSTALGKTGDDCCWVIGRGLPAGQVGEAFQGCIDEVRISNVALAASEFLFTPK